MVKARGRPKKRSVNVPPPISRERQATRNPPESTTESDLEEDNRQPRKSKRTKPRNPDPVTTLDQGTDGGTSATDPTSSNSAESLFQVATTSRLTEKVVENAHQEIQAPKNGKETDDEENGWKTLPDLVVADMTAKDFNFITNDTEHQQFELRARLELREISNSLEFLDGYFRSNLRLMRVNPDYKSGKLSEAILTLGSPKTMKELFLKLYNLPKPKTPGPISLQPCHTDDTDTIFEVSEGEEESAVDRTPDVKKPEFPSPAKMAKYCTPKQKIYHFGSAANKGTIKSTCKAPRLAKPGEVVYSQGGSPILQRRVPFPLKNEAKASERVEFLAEDGSKIEVDMVFRGKDDANKIRGFKDFARDVRGIAASRSTVKRNRIQPRIIPKGVTQSAIKSKPQWR